MKTFPALDTTKVIVDYRDYRLLDEKGTTLGVVPEHRLPHVLRKPNEVMHAAVYAIIQFNHFGPPQ